MDDNDYPSDSDHSDADYKPEAVDSDNAVQSDSDIDDIEEDDSDNDKSIKRKRNTNENCEKKKFKQTINVPVPVKVLDVPDEVEKKRADALWADFLSDAKPVHRSESAQKSTVQLKVASKPSETVENKKNDRFDGIFDSAPTKEIEIVPELSEVQKPKERTKKTFIPPKMNRSGGGLSSILGQIGKPNKMSVLEKSKLDWTGFKKKEGIDEELQTFNKGKDGYLERQDFLERTDVKQFEIERNLRQGRRNR